MATNEPNPFHDILDLKLWTASLSGSFIPKISIDRMLKSRELGRRERPISHYLSSRRKGSTLDSSISNQRSSLSNGSNAFTLSEKAYLVNRFLPNGWTLIAMNPNCQFFRCLHLANEEFVTLDHEKRLNFFARQQSKYKLVKQKRLPVTGPNLITDFTCSTRGDQLAYTSYHAFVRFAYAVQIDDDANWTTFHVIPTGHRWATYYSLRYTLDDEHLIIGEDDGYVAIVGTKQSSFYSFKAHDSDVVAVHCSKANPNLFYSAGTDGCCKLWDGRTVNNNPVAVSAGNECCINYIDGDSYDKYIVTTSADGVITIWDLRRFSENVSFNLQQREQEGTHSEITNHFHAALNIQEPNMLENFWRAKFSPERTGHRYIYCSDSSGYAYIWDILSGEIIQSYQECTKQICDSSWHPNDNEIISVSLCGAITGWYYGREYTSIK